MKDFVLTLPYSDTLISFTFPELYQPLSNTLKMIEGINTLSDVLGVNSDRLERIPNVGKGKIERFVQLQQLIANRENWEHILNVYDSCIKEHRFPENLSDEQSSWPLTQRLGFAIEQYMQGLKDIASYSSDRRQKRRLNETYDRIKLLFVEKKAKTEIAEVLGKTVERVRQLKVSYIQEMALGSNKDASTLKLSDEILEEINVYRESLPVYCSESSMEEGFDESDLCLFMGMKSVPNIRKSIGDSPYANFDQIYYIPRNEDMRIIQFYIDSLYKVMGGGSEYSEIRPNSLECIMDLFAMLEPEFDFDRDVVRDLLEQHLWYENVGNDENPMYQIKYEFLSNYAKLGRLIYEQKRFKITEGWMKNSIQEAKKHFPWIVKSGQNGFWEYNEDGVARTSLSDAIALYVQTNKIFYFHDLLQHLSAEGYVCSNEKSIRSYIFGHCHVSTTEKDLFCYNDFVTDYQNYTWRRKTQSGIGNWVVNEVRQCLLAQDGHKMDLRDLEHRIIERAVSEEYFVRDIWRYISRYVGSGKVFEQHDKLLLLTDQGINTSDEEWVAMAKRNRKPSYYDVVVSKIISLLKDAPNCEMPLRELRDACKSDIATELFAPRFYKIVDNELPEEILKYKREGVVYLKFELEKINYEPSVTISASKSEDIVDPSFVSEVIERKERDFGQIVYMDWNLWKDNLSQELRFYEKYWDLDISMSEGLDRFVKFVRNQEHIRISEQIPRKLFILWNYRSDIYDRRELLNELVLCYEQLLRLVHLSNTGERMAVNGLYATYTNMPSVNYWAQNTEDTFQFRKYFKYIQRLRNRIAHGEDLNLNSLELMQRITEYTALYVYTVSRFANI